MSRSLRPLAELATPRRLWRIHRRFLSTEWTRLSETHSYLRDATRNREIHLIGTAHVSQKSADEVRDLIHLVRPSHVAVELCPSRLPNVEQLVEIVRPHSWRRFQGGTRRCRR